MIYIIKKTALKSARGKRRFIFGGVRQKIKKVDFEGRACAFFVLSSLHNFFARRRARAKDANTHTHTHTHTHTIKKRRGNSDDDDDGDGLTHCQCNHHHRDHSKKRKKNEDRSSWHKIDEYEKKIYKCSRWDARTKRTERRG